MRSHIDTVKTLFRKLLHMDSPLSIRGITKKNLPCFIGWIAVFIWLYSYFLPMGEFRFHSKLYNGNAGSSMIYYYIWLISVGLIPTLFEAKKIVAKTFYSVLISLVCFGLMTFTGSGFVSEGIMIVFAICIGHIFTSFLYIFFMILNNSEKLYAMVLAVLLPRLLMLGKPFINQADNRVDGAVVIILIIILILLGCTYFLDSRMNSLPKEQKNKVPVKAFSLIPLVFIMLTLNDVIAPSVLNQMETQLSKSQIEGFYFIGSLLGILAVVFLQRQFSINISYMLNISLALLAIGFTVNLVSLKSYDIGFISAVCFGGSYAVGIINTYYLAGFMTKKFQSIFFYRIGMVLFALYYLFGFALQNLLKTCRLMSPSAIMAFISICIVLLFFIMSPFFIKTLFLGDWIDDTYRSDVTKCTRLEARLIELKLTPAEIEVCKLLLDGYTLRQISGIQSKAYSTINTYCTSIYRKLDINSRAELLIILQEYKA